MDAAASATAATTAVLAAPELCGVILFESWTKAFEALERPIKARVFGPPVCAACSIRRRRVALLADLVTQIGTVRVFRSIGDTYILLARVFADVCGNCYKI